MKKPTKKQLKKAGVFCAKIAIGDYLGAAQDLSFNSTFVVKITQSETESEAITS